MENDRVSDVLYYPRQYMYHQAATTVRMAHRIRRTSRRRKHSTHATSPPRIRSPLIQLERLNLLGPRLHVSICCIESTANSTGGNLDGTREREREREREVGNRECVSTCPQCQHEYVRSLCAQTNTDQNQLTMKRKQEDARVRAVCVHVCM